MISQNYAKAYTEVLEILSFLPINEYGKIPKQKLDYYYANKDCEYDYHFDFENPVFLKETAAILINIYKNYIVSSQEEKENIEKILDLNSEVLEVKKKEKYNSDNIFKNKITNESTKDNAYNIVEYKESIFVRIMNWFKSFF